MTWCGTSWVRAETTPALRQRLDDFAFDVEVLWIARKLGYRIAEVPVAWYNHPVSSVRLVRSSLAMLRDIAVIRINDLAGRYEG